MLGFRKVDGFSGAGSVAQTPGTGCLTPVLATADHTLPSPSGHRRGRDRAGRERGLGCLHASSLCLFV